MDYYEACYWVRTKSDAVVYLATFGGPLDKDNLDSLLIHLSRQYDSIISFGNSFQFVPEDNAQVIPYVTRKDRDTLKIDLWLADSKPVQYAEYLGKNPIAMKYKLNVEAHCWDMYRPANIVDVETNLAFMLNEFMKLKEAFPANCLLRFKMFMDDLHLVPYVYGYFVPLDKVFICREKLIVNRDEYPLEFCGMYQAFYFTIDKNKYDSGCNITEKDLKMLD